MYFKCAWFSLLQRNFLLHQIRTNTVTLSQTIEESKRPWNTHLKTRSNASTQESAGKRWKECRSQAERIETPRKQGLPNTAELMYIWTHRDLGSKHRAYAGSHKKGPWL